MRKRLFICTDGSAITGKHSPFDSAAAYVIYDQDGIIYKGSKFLPDHTNNYAEMYAVFAAAKYCLYSMNVERYDDIIFTTDSELTQKTLTTWILGWNKASDDEILVNSKGVAAKNQELIKSTYINILLLQLKSSVYICHINSHQTKNNIEPMYKKFIQQINITMDDFRKIYAGNDICDKLAKKELGID